MVKINSVKTFPIEQFEKFKKMNWEEKVSIAKICDIYGLSHGFVCNLFKFHNTETNKSKETRHGSWRGKINQEMIDEVCKRYSENGESSTKICLDYNLSLGQVTRILKENKIILRNRGSNGKVVVGQEEIIRKYIQGVSKNEICRSYGTCHETINTFLSEIKQEDRRMESEKFDNRYFETIDTFYKAYFLGLLIADGCLLDDNQTGKFEDMHRVAISLQERDGYLIEKFAKEINWKLNLSKYHNLKTTKNEQPTLRLHISNKRFAKDLFNVGLRPRKSFDAFIQRESIPENLLSALILGIFDGDGCVSFTEGMYGNGKSKKRYNQVKFYFSIVGASEEIYTIQDILAKNEIKSFVYGRRGHYSQPLYGIFVKSKSEMIKLYKYLYQNAPFFLKRKKEKFEELFLKLGLEDHIIKSKESP